MTPGSVYGIYQFRRGTAAEAAASNIVLASGELGIETDTRLHKIGDGVTPWNSLQYGGLNGPAGRGIVSVTKAGTGAPGTTDTYTITFTSGPPFVFTVTNGADGSGGSGGNSFMPTFIAAGQTFVIPANSQALIAEEIDLGDGAEIDLGANSSITEVN